MSLGHLGGIGNPRFWHAPTSQASASQGRRLARVAPPARPFYARPMTIDADEYRAALSQLASGVCVVTMRADGEDHGFTATSVTSLSLVPMLVLVCVANNQRSHALLEQTGQFAVNLLASAQAELGVRFATGLSEQRFSGLALARAVTGAPILEGCLAWLDCDVREILPAGDHGIVIGEVRAAGSREEGRPLVYFRRQWGTFTME